MQQLVKNNDEVNDMESLWSQRTKFDRREELITDLKTEVCIIGAGMAGLLCAALLQKEGKEVIIVEANTIASGQTKNTTAKITSQVGLFYGDLQERLGTPQAKIVAKAYHRAIDEFESIIHDKQISCHFERLPAYLYSKKNLDLLKREYQAAITLDLPAKYQSMVETPDGYADVIEFENQAQFDPLRFLQGIVTPLRIFENSLVMEVQGNKVITKRGSVTADWIIFACHFPIVNFPGYYFMKMHQERSYVLALKNTEPWNGMYYGIDDDGLSFRWDKGILLLGGANHRTGENSAGGSYATLEKASKKLFSQGKEMLRWSAQDCMTLDQIPYVGQYARDKENWLVTTGFNKWGMTGSMIGAMILSDKIIGRENPAAEVFNSMRSMMVDPIPLAEEGRQAVKGLIREIFTEPIFDSLELECGHGGVVTIDGHKVGVYKNEYNEVFAVSVRCPHLGCQLEWNPDEKSWDCPCHGSRFDYCGRLLDNPAQTDLDHHSR